MDAIRILVGTKPVNVTWKKVLEAEENVEIRSKSESQSKTMASVIEDREISLELMRVLDKFGSLRVKSKDE